MLLWELITLKQPYENINKDEFVLSIINNGLRPDIPVNLAPVNLINLINLCWSENPNERPSFPQITTYLYSSNFHFFNTNEETFNSYCPIDSYSTLLISSFQTQNWDLLNDIISKIDNDLILNDIQLIPAIIDIFPNLNFDLQNHILIILPYLLNFEEFLSMKGYNFLISIFISNPNLVPSLIKSFRTIDLSSSSFRQSKLLNLLCKSNIYESYLLISDLCEFEDISEYIIIKELPFNSISFDQEILFIYFNLLKHYHLRYLISQQIEPLIISSRFKDISPFEVCQTLSKYQFNYLHSQIIIDNDLFTFFLQIINFNFLALKILIKMIPILDINYLLIFSNELKLLIQRHQKYFFHLNEYLNQIFINEK